MCCLFGHKPTDIEIIRINFPCGLEREYYKFYMSLTAKARCYKCGVFYQYSEDIKGSLVTKWCYEAYNKLNPKTVEKSEKEEW